MRNILISIALFFSPALAAAADINVIGLFSNKAVVSINGGKPRTLSVGDTAEGVKLIAANSESATFELGGKRQTLAAGQGTGFAMSVQGGGSGSSVTLVADSRGHFVTSGTINGGTVRFLVDTGATSIAMSSQEARRLGLNYVSGVRGMSQTANGTVPIYRIKLDVVRLGDITVNNVDADVIEGDKLSIVLLGMSFLNRMEMKRDGGTMVLTKRY